MTRTTGSAEWDETSRDYHSDVVSPFAPGVQFPLRGDLRRILSSWRNPAGRVVMDLGCGCGFGLVLAARHKGTVVGLDYSEGMLDQSEQRLTNKGRELTRFARRNGLRNVRASLAARRQVILVNGDLRNLAPIHQTADVVITVNAMIPPTARTAHRMFAQVAACLKRGGRLLATFPACESVQHLAKLEGPDISPDDFGHLKSDGVFVYPDGGRQKYYGTDEIHELCKQNKLRVNRLDKASYPWSVSCEAGWGFHPGRPRLWDWYLVAQR